MKKTSQDKLRMYSALAGTAIASSAGAQVVFTDVNPDAIVHDTAFYNLDLNNDGNDDFIFRADTVVSSSYSVGLATVNIVGDTGNAVLGSIYASMYPFPFALNNGDTVKPGNPNWNAYAQNSGLNYLGVNVAATYTYGNWVGAHDKYIGLRIDSAGTYHYGWARLSVSAGSDTIIVKEYAYEQTANQYIICGMVAGVPSHHPVAGINIHAYESSVFVHTAQPENGGKISIYDMSGQLVREEEVTSGEMKIDMAGVATGMYVVHVQQGETISSQKIYLR
jgi:hypothetical protein